MKTSQLIALWGGSIRYENHWICEYWSDAEHRWIQVDAQIDDRQRQLMGIEFNTRNLPQGQFVTAGEGWRRFRDGRAPLASFGVFGRSLGWSMVMPNVVCDTMALNKDELLPWDTPPYWDKKQADMTPEDTALIQKLAEWDWDSAAGFGERRALYRDNPNLRMPADFEKKKS
jgi:hypothetical protein